MLALISQEEVMFMFTGLKKSCQKIINMIPFTLVRRSHIVSLENKIYELQYVIDSVPCSIFWMDKSFTYMGCNKKQRYLFKNLDPSVFRQNITPHTELIGLTIFDLFNEQFSTPLHLNDKAVLENGEEKIFEESCVDNDGNDVHYLSIKTPKLDREDNINGMVGVAIDITKQKVLEVELKNALELTKDSMRVKDAFIDSLSHDIRTPLTGILGLIHSLKKQVKSDPKGYQTVLLLEKSTQAFLNFFNGILSSVENIEEENKYEVMEVQSCIAELKALFDPALVEKGLSLAINIDTNMPPTILCARSILIKIITNLIGNAIKFTDKGLVTIALRLSDAMLEVQVIDTGMGISTKDISKIFERFGKLNTGTKKKYPGSGLGLFMVQRYIDHLGGSIDVQSTPGKGSCFTVLIPYKASSFVPKPGMDDSAVLSEQVVAACQQLSPRHILIIEDTPLAAMALENMIVDFGHRVDIAETGERALKALRSNAYDMLFLDQDLPDTTGVQLMSSIREISTHAYTPVIMLSGFTGGGVKTQALAAGCQGVAQKPMMHDALARILFQHFVKKPVDVE